MPFTTINNTVATTVTLNSGAYTSPLRILPTAAIAPSAYGATGLVATVSGYVLNEGLISAGGDGVGVDLAAGTLTNNGGITGGSGTNGGNAIDLAGGTLFNQGSITGGSATNTGGIGIDLTAGVLYNYGIISGGTGATGGAGIYLTINTLTNYGTIEGGAGSTVGIGVVFKSGGTLRDFGVIGGSDAVYFGSGASRLIFMPGASFTGAVVADAANTNVLELASAATAGTLAGGIGTQYQDFSTIAVDAGAHWTLTGANTLAPATSLVVNGTLTNNGTISGGTVDLAGGSLTNRGTIAGAGIHVTVGNVANSGTITGSSVGVSFASGGSLTNSGSIAGAIHAVYFGAGAARLILDPGASFAGTVLANASFANVLELAGTTAGTLTSALGAQYQGFGTIDVDPDANWTLSATNTITAGSSVITGGHLSVAGNIRNDGLVTGSAPGLLAISLVAGGLTNAGTITGAIAGGGGVMVTAGTLLNSASIIGGVGTNASYASTGGIAVALDGGTLSNAGTIAGGAGGHGIYIPYGRPARGGTGATAVYFSGGSLINNGSIFGGAGGFADSGPVAPGKGGLGGTGVILNGTTFTNDATIAGGAGGRVAGSHGPIGRGGYGVIVKIGNLVNQGLIAGGVGTVTPGAYGGIYIDTGGGIGAAISTGTLTNYGTIEGGAGGVRNASGWFSSTGVRVLGGTLINHGTIYGGSGMGTAAGGAGILDYADGTNFTNYGVIVGGAGGTVGLGARAGTGVTGPAYGTLINLGTIIGGAGGYGGPGVHIGNVNEFQAETKLLINSGSIIGGAGTRGYGVMVSGGGTLIDSGFIGGGTVTSGVADAIYFQPGDARLILDPGASFRGAITAFTTFNTHTYHNLLELNTGSGIGTIVSLGSTVTGFGTITFDSAASWFVGGNTAGIASGQTITGFAYGDTIELTNFVSTRHSFNSSGLILSAPGTSETLGIVGGLSSGDFTVTNDGTNSFITVCFAAGTRILTPHGEVPVEYLRVDDLVTTHWSGVRPIRWIGTGRVLATRGRRTAATPVIVLRGALADNVPCRDLRVTKGHSLFIDDVLIPVEFLVNHRSIMWDDRAQEVAIYHVELETHDVLIADGAPAESYRDDGNRWLFRNANAGWNQPPQEPCAPILTGGPLVDALWWRLLDRAGSRPGVPLTGDPDLHLVVDGERIDASSQYGDVLTFHLAQRPDSVRIVSRSAAPDQLGLARDPRELGVALRRITFIQGRRITVVEAADERLMDGFHDFEPRDGIRWTDGDALLPAALMPVLAGPFDIELHVACTASYPLLGKPERRAAA